MTKINYYDPEAPVVREFQGQWRFLSNFWWSKVALDGVEYPTVEHAYQAAKNQSAEYRSRILACSSPHDAKRISRFTNVRRDWDEATRLSVMEDLVRQKFSHQHLREMLMTTGDMKLEEGNRWNDTFWGKCGGRGENHLGRIIMRIRKEIVDAKLPRGQRSRGSEEQEARLQKPEQGS